jgi:uncharacterized protein YlxW (UPF0749 family)
MVNKQVVLETIQRMNSSGIDRSVIEKTLKDIGLKEDEIAAYLSEASAGGITENLPKHIEEKESAHETIAVKTAEKVKEHLTEERDDRELRETTLHNQMDSHHDKLEDMQDSVSTIHSKLDSMTGKLSDHETLKELAELNKRIADFEEQLSDLKALGNATKTIMEKILEVNRNILSKL